MNDSYANSTLTAFFDNWNDAQDAAGRLRALGIADSSIRIVGEESRTTTTSYRQGSEDRGFWESLGDFFFPDEDRATYAEGLNRGGTLLTVSNIPSALYEQALDILDDEGSVDVDARAETWRSEGWSSENYRSGSTSLGDTAAGATLGATATSAIDAPIPSTSSRLDANLRGDRDEEVIPVVEEQIRVGKRDVNLGRVRVRSYVVEEPVREAVHLRDERVVVERRPVDRVLTGTEAAFTDRVIEAEEHAEEAVVSKEARVKEEIALHREAQERTETISDTVRRTEVEIEDERSADVDSTLGANRTVNNI